MKAENFTKENIRSTIQENRELLIPICAISISVALFIIFILPNLLSFPSKKGDRDTEVTNLNKIKAAKNVLQNTNTGELSSDVDLTSNVLPSDKNFELVLGAISQAAIKSGAQVVGYDFSDSGKQASSSQASFPAVQFEVNLSGDIDQASKFVDQLYATYPISEVKSISYSNGISKIDISFYYKPFTSTNAENVALARGKTAKEEQVLSQITQWNTVNVGDFINQGSASQSASPF